MSAQWPPNIFTCRHCGAKGDPPICDHFQQPWTRDEIASAYLHGLTYRYHHDPMFYNLVNSMFDLVRMRGPRVTIEDIAQALVLVREKLRREEAMENG